MRLPFLAFDAVEIEQRLHAQQPVLYYRRPRALMRHVIEAWVFLDEGIDFHVQVPFSRTPSFANAFET